MEVNMDDLASRELSYYKNVCDIQKQHINGEISKEEMETLCSIERQKFMSFLTERNLQLQRDIENQIRTSALIKAIWGK